MKQHLEAQELYKMDDDVLTDKIETKSIIVDGMNGLLGIIWKCIELAFANKGKLRKRIEQLEADRAKYANAINKLEAAWEMEQTNFADETAAVQPETPATDLIA